MDYAGFGPFAAIQISWLTLAVWILASTSAAFWPLTLARFCLSYCRVHDQISKLLDDTREFRFERLACFACFIKVSVSAHDLQQLGSCERLLRCEVTNRALQRVCRYPQCFGIAAADCLLYFGQPLRIIGEKKADEIANKSTIAIDACQQRRTINEAVVSSGLLWHRWLCRFRWADELGDGAFKLSDADRLGGIAIHAGR